MVLRDLWAPACLLFLICLGCGNSERPSLVSVTGTVLLDGIPVEGAVVSFLPDSTSQDGYGRPSRGTTDQSGTFTPGTYQTADGLPMGTFKVIVVKQEKLTMQGQPILPNSEEMQPENYQVRYIVPKSYSDPQTSGLVVEVTADGMTPSEFQLQSDPQGVEVERVRP